MQLEQRIIAFSKLGAFLSQFSQDKTQKKEAIPFNEKFFDGFSMLIKRAKENNGWFTEDNVRFAIHSWSKSLTNENLVAFSSKYTFKNTATKNIAIVLAGNIPLVGFHDFLCVLLSGNHVIVKQSSNDKHFLPFIAKYLESVETEFKNKINFSEGNLTNFDAVIATGSDNTARYFDYYFSKYPHIIRKNRNSVAVLNGKETNEDLEKLGTDIFQYFGLGCRSVSKLFVPKDFNFDLFFKAIFKFNNIINYPKYSNNYDYNKAVYLMSLFKLKENGFLMLKEDENYGSPIATLFFEYYDDLEKLEIRFDKDVEKIQCIVSNKLLKNSIAFGETQQPKLNDFADGVDTMQFLIKLTS